MQPDDLSFCRNAFRATVACLVKSLTNEFGKGWAVDSPLQCVGEPPREVADTIVWLASEPVSFITGQTLLVDSGSYKGL
ncbi:MAG: hypothetical protein NVS1B11_09530 [Terriglobales bacterium]